MSVENFKPTLWEGSLLYNFHNTSVVEQLCTKPASVQGDKVIFNRVSAGSVKDYTGTIDWDEINTTPIEMTFPKRKYFAFSLDDCDKAQLKADVMNATTAEHSAKLAEVYDADFFIELANNTKNKIGSKTQKIDVSSLNIYDYIVDLGVLLGKNKVPKANRFCTVTSEILGLLSKDPRFTSNPNVLANGIVEGQTIGTMQIVCSEELPANTIVAHHKSAIGAAKQLQELEALRLQNSFSDGVRGLCMYGSKILRDEAIATLYYNVVPTAETVKKVNVVVANTEENPIPTKPTA